MASGAGWEGWKTGGAFWLSMPGRLEGLPGPLMIGGKLSRGPAAVCRSARVPAFGPWWYPLPVLPVSRVGSGGQVGKGGKLSRVGGAGMPGKVGKVGKVGRVWSLVGLWIWAGCGRGLRGYPGGAWWAVA